MDREVLKEILNTRYFEFTSEEIENIMNEELAKSPEEMDTDLVDLCLDALDGKFDYLKEVKNTEIKKKGNIDSIKKRSAKKVFLIAAVIILLACVTVGVFADHKNIDVINNLVELRDGYYKVDLSNVSESNDSAVSSDELLKTLTENGIADPMLPQVIFEDGNEISDLDVTESEIGEKYVDFYVHIKNHDCTVEVVMRKNIGDKAINYEQKNVNIKYDSVEEIKINEISGLLFTNDREYTALYIKENTRYELVFTDYEYEQVKSIIESIN